MKSFPVLALALALGLTSATVLHADDAPEKKATTKPSGKGPRVTGIFAKMDDLTFDERTQINKLHKQALDEIKKIEDKEESDCMDLLTPDQKDEATKIKDGMGVKKKKGSDATPATQPTKDAM